MILLYAVLLLATLRVRPGLPRPLRGHQRHRGRITASRAGRAGAASVMGVVLDLRQGDQIRSGSFRLKPNLK